MNRTDQIDDNDSDDDEEITIRTAQPNNAGEIFIRGPPTLVSVGEERSFMPAELVVEIDDGLDHSEFESRNSSSSRQSEHFANFSTQHFDESRNLRSESRGTIDINVHDFFEKEQHYIFKVIIGVYLFATFLRASATFYME